VAGCRPDAKPPGSVHDVGAVFIDETPTVRHTFRVVNTTDRPVEIRGEDHTCTCTTVTLRPGRLQPGETTTLEMVIDEADFATPPPDSAFRLEFDEPRTIYNAATSELYPAQKVWDLARLPRAVRINTAGPPAVAGPEMAGTRRRWSAWPIGMIGLGLLALVGAVALFRRLGRDR